MILTVYGDRYVTGEHIVRPYTWAVEDHWHHSRGDRAHPDNIPHSVGYKLSKLLHIGFHAGVTKDSTVENIIDCCIALEHQQPKQNILLITWNQEHLYLRDRVETLGSALEEEDIPHCFINTETRFEPIGGRWLWDTSENDLVSWADSNNLMNNNGLSSLGHMKLANLCFRHLTKQFSNLIMIA